MATRRSVALGCGHYLPERRITNDELAETLDTSDEWIRTRSGIRSRQVVAEDETTADIATAAARAALEHSQLEANDIDLVLLATSTPDQTFPATATRVQHALGMTRGFAFDMQAVCSGFLYALVTADSYLKSKAAHRVLVIGAETFSRILDWSDRSTAVLFGDGAGALVLEAREADESGDPNPPGILASRLRSDGNYNEILYVDGGVASGRIGHVRMQGREVFRHAVRNLQRIAEETIAEAGTGIDEIDWIVPHQANIRIINRAADSLGVPRERVVVTIADHANTSAASIPLALSTAVADGRIERGQLLLLEAMGGGLTWGASVVRW